MGSSIAQRIYASYTNEKQGTAALFASQKPGCLQVPDSASLGQNERAQREKQRWGRLFLYQQLVV